MRSMLKRKLTMMDTTSKLEFAVQMTCESCSKSITAALSNSPGVQSVSVDLPKQQVVVNTILPSVVVQELIESTGRRAVLLGVGTSTGGVGKSNTAPTAAAVAIVTGSSPRLQGVIRLAQTQGEACVFDGTIDGLMPEFNYEPKIHEFGDLSDGCNSCGEVFSSGSDEHEKNYGDLGCKEKADQDGTVQFRFENRQVQVWDVIGRSIVLHQYKNDNSDDRVACGIIARSSGLFENSKRICACDGIPLWDERDYPIAGGRRQTPIL